MPNNPFSHTTHLKVAFLILEGIKKLKLSDLYYVMRVERTETQPGGDGQIESLIRASVTVHAIPCHHTFLPRKCIYPAQSRKQAYHSKVSNLWPHTRQQHEHFKHKQKLNFSAGASRALSVLIVKWNTKNIIHIFRV